ncbi:MAG: cytochrome c oxidase assembly protein [Pseudomonadota bacterium]
MSEQAQVLLASFGPVSAGMAAHILLMNLLAPIVALGSSAVSFPRATTGSVAPMVAQLLLLFGWHAPPALAAAMEQPELHVAMQLSLTVAAFWFWKAVVDAAATRPWRALTALLLTSKIFCLLGVLLTFAPRALYPQMMHHGVAASDPLADQQLAGLMMLIACPLSYLVAAVVVASRWLVLSHPGGRRSESAELA